MLGPFLSTRRRGRSCLPFELLLNGDLIFPNSPWTEGDGGEAAAGARIDLVKADGEAASN